jgi:hypothetical protein
MDLSVKGQHGDKDITKSCIVCMMKLIWLQQLGRIKLGILLLNKKWR